MKVKREATYIEDFTGNVYVPRPSNWLSGWLRSRWFQHLLKKKPRIAAPDYWEILSNLHITYVLKEYEDGRVEINESR